MFQIYNLIITNTCHPSHVLSMKVRVLFVTKLSKKSTMIRSRTRMVEQCQATGAYNLPSFPNNCIHTLLLKIIQDLNLYRSDINSSYCLLLSPVLFVTVANYLTVTLEKCSQITVLSVQATND